MLRDLYAAAWVRSAEPVPDWHGQQENSAPKSFGATELPPGVTIGKLTVTSPQSDVKRPDTVSSEPFTGEAYHVGGGVSAPRLTYAPDPRYPDSARKAKYQGVVIVGLICR